MSTSALAQDANIKTRHIYWVVLSRHNLMAGKPVLLFECFLVS